MTKPRLIYFDAPVSRGEECRLALHLAGIDFEDVRLQFADWPAYREKTPFGAIPVLELPGRPALAQSNAILVFIGRGHGLHPEDAFEAARHEAMMGHVEDLRGRLGLTLRMKDEEKKRVREELAATYIPHWASYAERQLAEGPFFGGSKLNVVDLKIYSIVRWLTGGSLDHVPSTILADCPKLLRAHDAVRDHEGVRGWYARTIPAA